MCIRDRVLTACAKNTSDTDSNKANDTKTQDTSKDAAQDDTETEKTKEYQACLLYTSPGEIEQRIRIMDNVIRYLCVRQEA